MNSSNVSVVLALDCELTRLASMRQASADDPLEAERIDDTWRQTDDLRQNARAKFSQAEDVEYETRRNELKAAMADE